MSEVRMCTVIGNLSSDSTSDQYPDVPVCSDCIAAEEKAGEDSRILSVGGVVSERPIECAICEDEFED